MKTILIHNVTPDMNIPIIDFVDGMSSILVVEQHAGEFEAFRRDSDITYNHYPTSSTFVPNEVVPMLEIDAAELMTGVENEQEDARLFEQWNLGDWLSSYTMSCVSSFRTRLRNNRNPEADQVDVSSSELQQPRVSLTRAAAYGGNSRRYSTPSAEWTGWATPNPASEIRLGDEVQVSGTRSEGRDRAAAGSDTTETSSTLYRQFAEFQQELAEERRDRYNVLNGRNAQGY